MNWIAISDQALSAEDLGAVVVPIDKRIEDDLWYFVPQLAGGSTQEVTWKCEQAVRNYDPRISCVTHFMRLQAERE